ncbi:hypothetical protein SAMD00019534_124350 [Acytostelium subglobosum LB1]|uniref:hypothetical protein n=1 Tax=Acytostelium subglobosum LB1 TaxID=1410327 RepID=UPI00064512E0|nr:hypothetical protein SAMD00019534_124350 [Acytostelium subglobosum LB1]GAM29259.1 hypothetical protein SAMD00019534_124350 [Acytostelium subglobosum LB1]|eukprot:XP_012747757.1 hypothetical protein SAMD00019534_124350 [Acytostelium subglobosum LB1]
MRTMEQAYDYGTFSEWEDDDFYEWTTALFDEDTTTVLKQQKVDAEVFCILSDDDLKELHVALGTRRKIGQVQTMIKKAMGDHQVMSNPDIYTPVKRAEVNYKNQLPTEKTIAISSLTSTHMHSQGKTGLLDLDTTNFIPDTDDHVDL